LNNAIQTGVPHTNLTILRNTPIILPPLEEQRAIAHILGSLDDKIEANRRMNATLEATARALFKSWFVDFDPVHANANGADPIGMDAATAALFPDRFEDSELGPIPAGWECGTLGDIADNPRRSVLPEEVPADTLYVGLEHIPQQSLALPAWGTVDDINSNKYQFEEGEILFGKLRPYFHKVVFAPISGICSTDILVITPNESVFHSLALLHLSSTPVIEYATRVSTGTRMPRANWKNLAQYPVVVPPCELLEIFNAIVFPMLIQIRENVHQSRTLAETRDALLPKLVSGEIRVGEVT
jgi:type I restriction enzyme, S subunit